MQTVVELGKDDAERKQVTVLFADVKGSMDLAEQHDPEEWRKIMQRFFSILTEAVERFEGTVDKFTGDGIMAVFGAPIAHEDHARRACYAALQMLDDVSVYAGELRREREPQLLGQDRDQLRRGRRRRDRRGQRRRLHGDRPHGRAGAADGGARRAGQGVPDRAHRGAGRRASSTSSDLGEFEIKGASRPVRVFELAGVGEARSRLDLSRERGFSRFVGRAEEMDDLRGGAASGPRGAGAR